MGQTKMAQVKHSHLWENRWQTKTLHAKNNYWNLRIRLPEKCKQKDVWWDVPIGKRTILLQSCRTRFLVVQSWCHLEWSSGS